ncbi:uncharacterized protein BCR38DRAFT_405183 [Pseudomassariella vexata]|uniref:Uncharacterized protein n=1 Tax=Pseudomassariella vexata TaxID=1141098 RepID=A0A1Y2ED05_9PEZI|nr:uncharacterized protein BCR38DRAFT_405183 [Pseudomassariella vexata]ORY69463.1 hypothetical protein BCR38DRAFT_405183 [Pseudomassariella vexata]
MPSEEMEITTDFGPTGLSEDIDIDVEFVAGQPDEDLDLGDIDGEEVEHFNSDTRDELMAERDDASFGMVDADDLDYNDSANANNDYEIDLGGDDANMWQDNPTTGDENDYKAQAEVTARVSADMGDMAAQGTMEASASSDVAASFENSGSVGAIASQDFGSFHNVTELTMEPPVEEFDDREEVEPGQAYSDTAPRAADDFEELQLPNTTELTSHPIDESQRILEPDATKGTTGAADTLTISDEQKLEDGFPNEPEGDVTSGRDQTEDEQDLGQDENAEQHVLQNQDDSTWVEGTADCIHEEDQTGDEFFHESTTDDQITEHTTADLDGTEVKDSLNPDEDGSVQAVEDPTTVASRHEMIVNYGDTDYRLFAREPDDDPNSYFLRDMSALQLPLREFLSSIRAVISSEISPLNELVMYVDGLGLEFGETMASDFLDGYSFGDLISLYDTLLKNDDDAGDRPDLYMHLVIRPNCRQRIAALMESATAGRGFSEVAVYRPAPPPTPPAPPHMSMSSEGSEEFYYDDDDIDASQGHGSSYVDNEQHEGVTFEEQAYPGESNDLSNEASARVGSEEPIHESPEETASQVHKVNDSEDLSFQQEEYDELDEAVSPEQNNSNVGGDPSEGRGLYVLEETSLDEQSNNGRAEAALGELGDDDLGGAQGHGVHDDTSYDEQSNDDLAEATRVMHANDNPEKPAPEDEEATGLAGNAGATVDDDEIDYDKSDMELSTQGNYPNSFNPPILQISFYCTRLPGCGCDVCFLDKIEAGLAVEARSRSSEQTMLHSEGGSRRNGLVTASNLLQAPSNTNTHRSQDEIDAADNLVSTAVPTNNGPSERAASHSSSATATLNGDGKDEIDYSDDEIDVGEQEPAPTGQTGSTPKLEILDDDEITWESDNEEARSNIKVSRQSLQVSPAVGKRTLSDFNADADEDADEKNDAKRHRS